MPRTGGAVASVRGCQAPGEGWLLGHRVSFWSGESVLGLNGVLFAHHLLKTTRMCWISRQEGCVLSRSVVSDSLQPLDCSPPGSSVHGILQARILEWAAISSSRGPSRPRDQTHVSCNSFIDRFFTTSGKSMWLICYFFLKIGQSVFPGQTCKMQVYILFKTWRLKWGHDLLISVLGLMSRRDVSLVIASPGHRSQMPRPPRPCKFFFFSQVVGHLSF